MKIAIMFDRFGPYHIARARGVMAHGEVLAIESAPHNNTYDWVKPDPPPGIRSVVLTHGAGQDRDPFFIARRLEEAVMPFEPDVVALCGWATVPDLVTLRWCSRKGIAAVCMSETNSWDFQRSWLTEKVKQGIVAHYGAGLATSDSQMGYLERLGIPRDAIFSGYNAVDNAYFRSAAQIWRAEQGLPPEIADAVPGAAKGRYFLASSRFVAKKNLLRLLDAYAAFRAGRGNDPADWPLILLGDGELRDKIEAKIVALDLRHHVHLPGFLQVDALPRYYGTAGAFIHASSTEQWGLVVNEAMASGLPVAVSKRCGATEYLIEDGVSGFAFDPLETSEITKALARLAALQPAAPLIDAALRSVDRLSPERFGESLFAASRAAMKNCAEPGFLSASILDLAIQFASRAKRRVGS